MIKVQGDKKVDEKNYYLKWQTELKISQDAARITRYDHKKVQKEGHDPKEVFATIKDWLDHADYIIGHNTLGFDIYLIKEYYKYDNIPFEHWMLFNANHKKITRNDFTRLMIEAFKGTGNNITSSLIRKIVASDLIDVNKLKKQAYIEGHSIKTMLNSYVKG
jgi:DNA polymerase III alpha subunit (gram-positive type)